MDIYPNVFVWAVNLDMPVSIMIVLLKYKLIGKMVAFAVKVVSDMFVGSLRFGELGARLHQCTMVLQSVPVYNIKRISKCMPFYLVSHISL